MAVPITLEMLIEKKACIEQIEKFKEIFGKEAPLNIESAINNADNFDWLWAASNFLIEENLKTYDLIQNKAYNELKLILDKALNEYILIQNKDGNKFVSIQNKAWNEFISIQNKAWNEYKIIKAKTFAELYLSQ